MSGKVTIKRKIVTESAMPNSHESKEEREAPEGTVQGGRGGSRTRRALQREVRREKS